MSVLYGYWDFCFAAAGLVLGHETESLPIAVYG